MQVRSGIPLASLTTLRVGGPAREYVEAKTSDEVIDAVRSVNGPLLVLSGGSNLLVGDVGFDGRVVRIATHGVSMTRDDDGALVDVQAGVPWDELVALTVSQGLSGFETLSGIPGSTGATPVQNVGAYGEEIATSFVSLTALDRTTDEVVTLNAYDSRFGYRTSVFKRNDRFVILSVRFRLRASPLSVPVVYSELARALRIDANASAPLADVRAAVLQLRRQKGMVLDDADTDTHSAGSFFTNPVILQEQLESIASLAEGDPPSWQVGKGEVKVSAGWLIQRAGFDRGFQFGRARLSSKHALAITNAGGAKASELVALACKIRDGVHETFGIELQAEPVLVGVTL